MTTERTGTREWSDASANCQLGCRHACVYCYARQWAHRFRGVAYSNWTTERWDDAAEARARVLHGRRVMFPTRHDLPAQPERLERALHLLAALLHHNRVLVVTKGPRAGVDAIIQAFAGTALAERLEVRLTITSYREGLAAFWEPHAPGVIERMQNLVMLHDAGIATSVACEPMLDPRHVDELVRHVSPWVTGTIWLGRINQLAQRTAWYFRDHPEHEHERRRLRRDSLDQRIHELYAELRARPKIRWKDSCRRVLDMPAYPHTD